MVEHYVSMNYFLAGILNYWKFLVWPIRSRQFCADIWLLHKLCGLADFDQILDKASKVSSMCFVCFNNIKKLFDKLSLGQHQAWGSKWMVPYFL
jgi:hypothetical protein